MKKFLKKKKEVKINKEIAVSRDSIINTRDSFSKLPVLTDAPLFIRLTFILNSIKDFTDSKNNIDWSLINVIMTKPNLTYEHNKYDYNINLPTYYSNLEDLYITRSTIYMAMNNILPFYKDTCKTCDNIFTLNYGEINFYLENNLKVPTHCKSCIDKRKNV